MEGTEIDVRKLQIGLEVQSVDVGVRFSAIAASEAEALVADGDCATAGDLA